MGQEIERKFLVNQAAWRQVSKPEGKEIRQGYIDRTPEHTVRIRTKGKKGYITLKGKEENGIRAEFEYEIPYDDAVEMLSLFCNKVLHKTRFEINYQGFIWEVDEFHAPNPGLILAEIELPSIDTHFQIPDWIREEVTGRPEYYNANM
jgi:adenylate cyclase